MKRNSVKSSLQPLLDRGGKAGGRKFEQFAAGDGGKEDPPVTSGANPFIQDDHGAAVFFGADQAAEALFELDHRLRQAEMGKGVFSRALECFPPGLEEGFGRSPERETHQNDQGELGSGNVHTLPKTIHPEKYRPRGGKKGF